MSNSFDPFFLIYYIFHGFWLLWAKACWRFRPTFSDSCSRFVFYHLAYKRWFRVVQKNIYVYIYVFAYPRLCVFCAPIEASTQRHPKDLRHNTHCARIQCTWKNCLLTVNHTATEPSAVKPVEWISYVPLQKRMRNEAGECKYIRSHVRCTLRATMWQVRPLREKADKGMAHELIWKACDIGAVLGDGCLEPRQCTLMRPPCDSKDLPMILIKVGCGFWYFGSKFHFFIFAVSPKFWILNC